MNTTRTCLGQDNPQNETAHQDFWGERSTALRPCSSRHMLSRMTDQPSDPRKSTGTRGVARRSELAQVREDIRKLAKNITPLSDHDHMDEEWPTRLRLLLARYNELVKKPE